MTMRSSGFAAAFLALAAGLALAPSGASAQALTFEEARTAMDAAEAEARANDWNVVIVITDADGTPLYVRRMAAISARFHQIAMAKVHTLLESGLPSTGAYAEALREGRIEAIEGAVTFEGGYMIRRGGETVGTMTASGVRGFEDAQIVRAGLAAIGITPEEE
jgi:glc operon protein GlcG